MEKITEYLEKLKLEGKASPIGIAWAEFSEFLYDHRRNESDKPPVPLILAASYLSPYKKHERFRLQLEWALAHNIFEESLAYLKRLEDDDWVISSDENWYQDNKYWEDME